MKKSASNWHDLYLPPEQLEDLLKSLGFVVVGDTSTDLMCLCAFHNNKDTPSFNISLAPGHLWRCHNGKCDQKGNIITLLLKKGYTYSEAQKMILKGSYEVNDLLALVTDLMKEDEFSAEDDWRRVDVSKFRDADEEAGWPARLYLSDRGISQEAYDHFRMGYAASKNMLTIPVFNERGSLVGVIGRSIADKRYQYSSGMERRSIIWNANNAKVHSSIILTEGALDAVAIFDAGYDNVGAVLGSAISPHQWRVLRENFEEIVCFFDDDEAGWALTNSIIDNEKTLSVSVVLYPESLDEEGNHIKQDPGDLPKPVIREMIENRISSIELLIAHNT